MRTTSGFTHSLFVLRWMESLADPKSQKRRRRSQRDSFYILFIRLAVIEMQFTALPQFLTFTAQINHIYGLLHYQWGIHGNLKGLGLGFGECLPLRLPKWMFEMCHQPAPARQWTGTCDSVIRIRIHPRGHRPLLSSRHLPTSANFPPANLQSCGQILFAYSIIQVVAWRCTRDTKTNHQSKKIFIFIFHSLTVEHDDGFPPRK